MTAVLLSFPALIDKKNLATLRIG